jgi:hypothetical protein
MSTEEFGEFLDKDLSADPVIPEGMAMEEVLDPTQDKTGWSDDESSKDITSSTGDQVQPT